jgi:DNA-binding CsgD family transcriptional regulator
MSAEHRDFRPPYHEISSSAVQLAPCEVVPGESSCSIRPAEVLPWRWRWTMTPTIQHRQTRTVDHQCEHIRTVALGAFQAKSTILYWIEDGTRMRVIDAFGPCAQSVNRYLRDMKPYDPLNVERLISSRKRVATIGNDRYLAPNNEFERYSIFMQDSGFRDVMDFVFWNGEEAFAGLGVMKSPDDPPITSEDLRVGWAMQPYLEYNLSRHPQQREYQRQKRLRRVYGLTVRELEIANLISMGLTNQDIAEDLGIGLGTVKTHLLRVFRKLDVSNRTMLSMRISSLESDESPSAHRTSH